MTLVFFFLNYRVVFFKEYEFSVYMSFTSLVRFNPKHLIVLVAIINGIISLPLFWNVHCLCIETQPIFVC